MIKTLRITTIIAAIVAVLFFVLSAAFGLRSDKDKEAYLAKPTAVSLFTKSAKNRATSEPESPLIKQADAFALRINPPAPVIETPVQAIRPAETPKFRLLGTSFYPHDPNRSMALIDEPGKGQHWIGPSTGVGSYTITQIGDGKLTYTDGQKSMEMFAEKPQGTPQISVIQITQGQGGVTSTAPPIGTAVPMGQAAPEQAAAQPAAQTPAEKPSLEEIKSNVEFIRQVMAEANEAKATAKTGEMGISAQEANELKDLGGFLKQLEEQQKQAEAEANAVKSEPNSSQEAKDANSEQK
jgi:hypothetical protein